MRSLHCPQRDFFPERLLGRGPGRLSINTHLPCPNTGRTGGKRSIPSRKLSKPQEERRGKEARRRKPSQLGSRPRRPSSPAGLHSNLPGWPGLREGNAWRAWRLARGRANERHALCAAAEVPTRRDSCPPASVKTPKSCLPDPFHLREERRVLFQHPVLGSVRGRC